MTGDGCGRVCDVEGKGVDLFVYGTLMVPEVMGSVCGYAGAGEPALLHDYCRRQVRGELYPAIMASVGDAVGGVLYRGITPAQLALLDAFEGGMYRREIVTVAVGARTLPAASYVLAPGLGHRLSDADWSLDDFVAEGLRRFLADYPGFSALSVEVPRHGHRG